MVICSDIYTGGFWPQARLKMWRTDSLCSATDLFCDLRQVMEPFTASISTKTCGSTVVTLLFCWIMSSWSHLLTAQCWRDSTMGVLSSDMGVSPKQTKHKYLCFTLWLHLLHLLSGSVALVERFLTCDVSQSTVRGICAYHLESLFLRHLSCAW